MGTEQALASGSKVLLLTLGSTPQVVTETLYALVTADPPWIPDRIVLATTAYGKRLFEQGRVIEGRHDIAPLLGKDGMLSRLINSIGLPQSLTDAEIVVPADKTGQPIMDIRTEDETEAFAEALLKTVAKITAMPGSELHISLAGGRKTMSFIAGQVMSIFGRKRDHLSHVRVEPSELERQDSFWWPGDGSPNSEHAQIELYSVPYLRARAWVDPDEVMNASRGFAAAVQVASHSLGQVHVTLDLAAGHLVVLGDPIELGATQLATLALIAIARKRGATVDVVKDWHPKDRKLRGFALNNDRDMAHRLWCFLYTSCNLRDAYEDGPVVNFIPFDNKADEHLAKFSLSDKVAAPFSRLRQELSEELPPALAERIIAPKGFATALDPSEITILGPAELADHPAWPPEMSWRACTTTQVNPDAYKQSIAM